MTEPKITAWMCVCGHNRSRHRDEITPFRIEVDTACTADVCRDFEGWTRCNCHQFREATDGS